VHHRGRTYRVEAQLEPAELRLRGALRLAVPVTDIRSFEARGGALHVEWRGGTLDLLLGRDAEKWALKIRYPRGRLDKLGVKPGMRVAVIGLDDADFLGELRERTGEVTTTRPKKGTKMVVVALARASELPKLRALRTVIKPDGMIWVVWPKGRREFREDDVRAFGSAVGLVDVKVMSFSDTLSGLKLVIPKKDR
jgi:hypothetical protein